ncbi:MAG: hypothetical protein NTV50_04490 [Planctomycetota bacterium]|nr:hypothetical protein [Planctomycetota bacterium]
MYTNRKEGGGAGWQGDFVEELLSQSWKARKRSRSRDTGTAEAAAEELATE